MSVVDNQLDERAELRTSLDSTDDDNEIDPKHLDNLMAELKPKKIRQKGDQFKDILLKLDLEINSLRNGFSKEFIYNRDLAYFNKLPDGHPLKVLLTKSRPFQ